MHINSLETKVTSLCAEIEGLKTSLKQSEAKVEAGLKREDGLKQQISELKAQMLAMKMEVDLSREKEKEMQAHLDEFEKYREFYFDKKRNLDTAESEFEDDELFLSGFDKDGQPVFYQALSADGNHEIVYDRHGEDLLTHRTSMDAALIEENLEAAPEGNRDKLQLIDSVDSIYALLKRFESSTPETQKQILRCLVQQLVNEIR